MEQAAIDLNALPGDVRDAMIVASRCRGGAPEAILQRLVEAFATASAGAELMRLGLLERDESGDVRPCTRRLAEAARSLPHARDAEIERWLHDHVRPRPESVDQTLEAARRAIALGDRAGAATWLGAAWDAAAAARRWNDVLALLDGESHAATSREAVVTMQIESFAARSHRSVPAVALVAAAAFRSRDLSCAGSIWQRVASGDEPTAAATAAVALMENALRVGDDHAYDRHEARLLEVMDQGGVVVPGVLELKRAWREQNRGHAAAAETLARAALARLPAHESIHRALALQQLATLRFGVDRREGIELQRAALSLATETATAAVIRSNLALMLARDGDLEGCAAVVDGGLAPTADPPRLQLALRERRAWAWAALGRRREARDEALAIIAHPTSREQPARLVAARLAAAYVALHEGRHREALEHASPALEQARGSGSVALHAAALGWVLDICEDAGAGDFARERLQPDDVAVDGPAGLRLSALRVRAWRLQECGEAAKAVDVLGPVVREAPSVFEPEEAARALRHAGRVHGQWAQGDGGVDAAFAAMRLFGEALAILPRPGWDYLRLRIQWDAARAQATAGDVLGAAGALDTVIDDARRVEARGVLTDALRERARCRIATP